MNTAIARHAEIAPLDVERMLGTLQSSYTMAEERVNHQLEDTAAEAAAEITFF